MIRLGTASTILLLAAVGVGACVPNGPSSSTVDAGPASVNATAKPRPAQASPSPLPSSSAHVAARSVPLGTNFTDNFDRPSLGADWRITGADWRIEEGRLCVKNAHNHGAWLARTLPPNVRIEFDAISNSPEGDIKAEVFGDGASAASGVSYNDATSYLTIFGGWKNNFHVLARLNEHASDRPEIRIAPGSDDERARPVNMGQVYHFKIERRDGKTLAWWIGDMLMFKYADPEPLSGPGHDHFGFNDWEVPVCFDNVQVVAL